jgi:hypothetical protein
MNYFNIEKVKNVFKLFDKTDYNTYGVLLSNGDGWKLYSGNFWWSKSSHIRNLPKIVDTYYNSPEFLVTSIDGVYKSLWHSEVNNYITPYPASLYENRPIAIQKIERKNGYVYYD